MFYVYILQSNKNKELYIGYTSDLRKRIKEHNQGLNFSTKRYMPWKIIYYEACKEESDAVRREKYLKTTQGGRLIKRRIKDYLYKSSSILSKDNSLQDKSKNLIN
ncbi:MAG: GIY-YIG nuclease family protein [Patescibacteria group bacterium]